MQEQKEEKTEEFSRTALLAWLRETDENKLGQLWEQADRIRQACVGDAVYLRGLIEISNYCVRQCHYCGIRAGNSLITRYRMTRDEILECTRQAVQLGYGTVVLQSGEDEGIAQGWMAEVIQQIKRETPLAVTLSLGERTPEDWAAWKAAGADRYLLRFETSNPDLYQAIHPPRPGRNSNRLEMLEQLRALGYEVGSGVMIGIPGQTYADMANDIELFRTLDLDMIGVGPFIPHPETPLANPSDTSTPVKDDQVPNTELMTYKVIALTRWVAPYANIPSTTALATLNLAQGRELGLQRGANIVMPNLTPVHFRSLYEIYPAKACVQETAEQCQGCLQNRIRSIHRHVGQGAGTAPNYARRK